MSWKKEEIYHSAEEYFASLKHAVASARASVDFECYIVGEDELSLSLMGTFAAAALRGVRVRVLMDGVGSASWTFSEAKELLPGVEFRFFHPLPWQREGGWLLLPLRSWLTGLWKLNRRNHRKVCIIDGTSAFLGGHNLSAAHSDWRDSSVNVEGEQVARLSEAFEMAWAQYDSLSQWQGPRPEPGGPVRLNVTVKQRRELFEDLVKRIGAAQSRVWITNPYFIPVMRLTKALRTAAKRGVEVRLLLPRKSDVWGMRWAMHTFYDLLLSAGVRIHEYRPAVLHAKVLMIDDFSSVGSSNLNRRSLQLDLEVDVELGLASSRIRLEEQFLLDLAESREILLSQWLRRPMVEKVLEFFARALRRWL